MTSLLFLYFLTAGITWVSGETGQGIAGRVAASDIVLLVLIATVLATRARTVRLSRLGFAAVGMVLMFGLGVLNAENVDTATVEWLVHAFSVTGFIVLYSVISRMPIDERLHVAVLWVRAGTILAIFGLYEFIGGTFGLPSALAMIGQTPYNVSGLVGTFRNTGQSGVFFSVAIVTAIPLYRSLQGRARTEMLVSSILLGLALMFTVKRAAMIGFAIGVVLLFLMDPSMRGRVRNAVAAAVTAAVLIPTFSWMVETSDAYRWRIQYKLGARGADSVVDFARENVGAAERAFAAHPIVGVGVGGIHGVWMETHELHSTFLAVPAQTGVVGTIAYICFMITFFHATTRSRNGDPRCRMIGRIYLPLLLGLTVSFAYVYHLRKREFWITTAIASAIMAPQVAATRRSRSADAEPWQDWIPADPVPTGAVAYRQA